jgi:hypothetical protein
MHKGLIAGLALLACGAGPPSIDSHAPTPTHIANTSGQSTISAPITTTQSPDLVIVDFYAPAASASPAISTIDGCNSAGSGCSGALTWTRRYQLQTSQAVCGNNINITCHDGLERWTAVASGAVSETAAVVLNMSVVSAQVTTYGVFGLASTSTPYDPSFTGGPLTGTNTVNPFVTGGAGYTNVGVNVTTTNPNSLVLAVAASPFWLSGDHFVKCGFPVFTDVAVDDITQTLVNPQYARMGIEAMQFLPTLSGILLGFSNQSNPPMAPACVGPYAPWSFALEVMTGTPSGPAGGAIPDVWVNE